MKTTEVNDIVGTFVVKFCSLKTKNNLFLKIPLKEHENNFDEKFNDKNYKKTFMKLHDDGWKNIFFTSADVDMIVHGCGVSQYPPFIINI